MLLCEPFFHLTKVEFRPTLVVHVSQRAYMYMYVSRRYRSLTLPEKDITLLMSSLEKLINQSPTSSWFTSSCFPWPNILHSLLGDKPYIYMYRVGYCFWKLKEDIFSANFKMILN